jgi:hypothetical protein
MKELIIPGLLPLLIAGALTAPVHADSVVTDWNNATLQAIRVSKIGPPMVARALAIVHTCAYDAWSAYDPVALSTQSGGALRRPPLERTEANKREAVSFAAYQALADLFPAQKASFDSLMASLGYDPANLSLDPTTPVGLGNFCAAAVILSRHNDGANQLGDLHFPPYSDYTGYVPVNTVDQIINPNRWQPLQFCNGATPAYIGAFWGNVTPFALESAGQFRPAPPARYPHGTYIAQAEAVLHLNAHLDDRQKMIAEYWADGPNSELPPGHWHLFAQFVSHRDGYGLDQDVKLFFALGGAALDASIAVWECKTFYDSERPITAIRFLKRGKKILAWGGPYQGTKVINGEDWIPYQPCTFITPPFAEYCSGHSAFSTAGAEILKSFTGSDAFGASVTFPAGSSHVEPGLVPAEDLTLSWPTFSDAADEAGISRRYGGIHFEQGDLVSRALGRTVGAQCWARTMAYFNDK